MVRRSIGRWTAAIGGIVGGMMAAIVTLSTRAAESLPVAVSSVDDKLLYTGRADMRDAKGPRFEWSASMVTVRFRGTDLQAKINESGDDHFEVVVDRAAPQVIHPPKGDSVIDLAHGLPNGTHEVRMLKRTEAFVGRVQFTGFALNRGGELLPVPRPAHKIEVIGDSISCGYGNEGASEKEPFRPDTENAYLSYGAVAARDMNADYVCVAWSGKKMWPDNAIPELYDRALPTDPGSAWDFAKWKPDAVLINLATNDFGPGIPDADKWTKAYAAFVQRVRKNYPKATIYLASGSMMSDFWPPKVKALSTLNGYLDRIQSDLKAEGETNVRIIHFDPQNGAADGMGSSYHPSVKTDAKMAAKFESALNADLGWKKEIASTPKITVEGSKSDGVYAVGEKIVWHLKVTGEGADQVKKIGYVLKRGQLVEIGRGEVELKDGAGDLETTLDAPGTVLANLTVTAPDNQTVKGLAGALVAPSQIKPAAPPPADFADFWKAKVAELAAVPIDPILTPGDSGVAGVDYAKVTLGNIQSTHVQGQIARPTVGTKFPALLVVQWAGVYPLQKSWATGHARDGWLVLNINAHDLPIDQSADFYAAQNLSNYSSIGDEDRDKSYFLRMYLSCYRAADYLAHRPDWDGKTLVVMGTSQGGLQSILTAALYPKITAMLANVPAGCDENGPIVGRRPGWPGWYYDTNGGKDAARVRETDRYYDMVNFAPRITCPALVATGLIDETCPAAGVAAAFNQMRGPKELLVLPRSDHQGTGNTQAASFQRQSEWLAEIKAGKSPTVRPLAAQIAPPP